MQKIILAYGLFGLGYVVTATFLVAIIRAGEGGRLFESTVWLATGLAGIPSVYLWQSLAKRWGLTSTFAVACVVEALGVWASVGVGGVVGPLAGGVLLGGLFFGKSLLGYVFDSAFRLDAEGWRKLTLRWGLFFLFLAVVNEIVWRTFSTDAWVAFKVWGIMPITLAFTLSQMPLIMRHSLDETSRK